MRKRLLLLPCILALSAFALAACSDDSGDVGEVEEVIKTAVTSTDPADCKKLATQQFMQQGSLERGTAAVENCEEDAEDEDGAKSVDVSKVEVDGESATAEAAVIGGDLDGQVVKVELVKDSDGWKMNEVVEFTDFDHAKLIEALEVGLSEHSSEIDPQLGSCLIRAFEQGTQAEAEELLFGVSPKFFEEVLEACLSRPSA